MVVTVGWLVSAGVDVAHGCRIRNRGPPQADSGVAIIDGEYCFKYMLISLGLLNLSNLPGPWISSTKKMTFDRNARACYQ